MLLKARPQVGHECDSSMLDDLCLLCSNNDHPGVLWQVNRWIERPNKTIFHDASQGNRTPS